MPLPLAAPRAQHEACAPAPVFRSWSPAAPAPQPLRAPAALRLWHLLSLDAPTVAVVWSLAFAWAAGVSLPLWVPVLLALVTWSVYIFDRLLDARAGLRAHRFSQLRLRHTFHWRHRRILLPLAIVSALAAAAILVVSLPSFARAPDSVLAAATLAYFSGVHSRRRAPARLGRDQLGRARLGRVRPGRTLLGRDQLAPLLSKEFLVGLLFTVGCAVPAFTRLRILAASASAPFAALQFAAMLACFVALAWLNCHAIARWEARPAQHRAQIMPRTGIPLRSGILALAALLLATLVGPANPRFAILLTAAACSALFLALLDRNRRRLTPLALRAAADLVLLAPALLLFARFPA
ncbi:MAG TPA: hypothetical protein VND90_05680 [Terracidiphilus sp.]|nr:hypothetical protein [Terracidiphilus sp.]